MTCGFIDYRGKTPTKSLEGLPLITAKNVRWAEIKEDPREFITEEVYEAHMTRGFPRPGDVLFTTEAPLGFAATVETNDRFGLAQRLINLQPFVRWGGRCLMWWLLSPLFQAHLSKRATGTTVSGIKASRLKQLPVALPPLAEQVVMSRKIESLLAAIQQVESVAREQIRSLASLDRSVLAAAFRGELVPQDPSDEPASELLKRIREQADPATT